MTHSHDMLQICSIVDEKDCTGCAACMNACGRDAITMVENDIGHKVPAIDAQKCVECGLCRRVCPSLNPVSRHHPEKVYALWAADKQEHDTSTSGGVAAVLSRKIVSAGGVVYGCASQAGGGISHIRVDDVAGLAALKGSKYVQSDMNLMYRSVRDDLKAGREVLFCGTPCQIAGLRSFLRREYDHLTTLDLICHGTPPQKILFEHLRELGIRREDIDSISFREKEKYMLKVMSGGKEVYRKGLHHDWYLSVFRDSLLVRESCVQCRYALQTRTGDITVGDFRGLAAETPFEHPHRGCISCALVNTRKGERLLESCGSDFHMYERKLQEAFAGNPHLRVPVRRRGNYAKFLQVYHVKGFRRAAMRAMKMRLLKNLLLRIRARLKGERS